MRRLIAFIALSLSLLALVLFHVQGEVESLNWSQEYDKGTEVVYRINVPGAEEATVDIDRVIKVMGDRLEAAGATNYTLESAANTADKDYEVRITLGSRNTYDIDNILNSTSASGEFSVFTTDGTSAALDAIKRGTAEVLYNEDHEAYIRVETTKEVETVANQAKEETGDSLLVLWQNKTDDFDYTDLADADYICSANQLTSEQLKDRVLAVINIGTEESEDSDTSSIDNSTFGYDEDDEAYYLTFKAYGYAQNAESSASFTANSAHSMERILNSELLDYDITEVYRTTARADYGTNATVYMSVACAAAILILCIFLLCTYGLMAVAGCIGIALTVYFDLALMNLFALIVTPVTILSVAVTLAAGATVLALYYKRTKEEAYRGRALGKASNEGFRRTISTAIDATVVTFALGIVLALISREGIKIFSIFFVFSSVFSFLFIFLLTKFLNNFLLNSKCASNPKLFRIKAECIADLDGVRKEELPVSRSEKIDVKKASKKTSVAALLGIAVATVSLAGFGIFSSVFNFSNQEVYGRIEVRSAETRIFETVNDGTIVLDNSQLALNNFVYYLENVHKEDNVTVTNSWTITNQVNPYEDDKNYIYFYADLESPIESTSETYLALEEYVFGIDENETTTLVNVYSVSPGIVTNDFANTLVLMSVTVGIMLVYFLIRYRYTLALAQFATLTIGTFIALGLISLVRLETSAYVGIGILAGLLIDMIFMIPFGNRLAQLKNESKTKVTTYDQREEIAYGALRSSVRQYTVSVVGGIVLLLVLTAVSPIQMYPIYVAAILSLAVNGLLGLFAVIPLHLWFERHFKFSRMKTKRAQARQAKRERIAKANRNKGAEPEEIIIPGIND